MIFKSSLSRLEKLQCALDSIEMDISNIESQKDHWIKTNQAEGAIDNLAVNQELQKLINMAISREEKKIKKN